MCGVSTVLVCGALANKPFNGGNAWSRLDWVLGFKRLGFDVIFVEQIESDSATVDGSAYFKAVMDRFGLADSSALIDRTNRSLCGMTFSELMVRSQRAEILFNFSGHLTIPELKNAAGCCVYYDDDPGFTQIWHSQGNDGARLSGHDFHFTIGANIGLPGCVIPTKGVHWRHTRPPVVLDQWPAMPARQFSRFTTVGSWRGAYAPIKFKEQTYGVKAHEFRKVFQLPRHCGVPFEIALQIHPADVEDRRTLQACGWRLVDPVQSAGYPDDFRRYVQESSAEFSTAQGVYVGTHSGWFSDRTVRYLASGKPALVQDTGFSDRLPVGEGLLAFSTLDEALEGAERIVADYEKHCIAARKIAEVYFDSDQIISRLISEIGLEHPNRAKYAFD